MRSLDHRWMRNRLMIELYQTMYGSSSGIGQTDRCSHKAFDEAYHTEESIVAT